MTEEQRDNILISLSKEVGELTKELARQRQHMSKLEDTLTKKIDNNTEELVRQRQILAKIEYTLTDKIDILFDVREINSEKFEEQDERLESVEHTLDTHHRRILKLESNTN